MQFSNMSSQAAFGHLDCCAIDYSTHWQKHLVNKDSLVWCPMRQNAMAMHLVEVPLTLREAPKSQNLDILVICEHIRKHLNHQSCLVGIPVLKEKRAPALLAVFHEFALIACGATTCHNIPRAACSTRCSQTWNVARLRHSRPPPL